MLRLSKKTDYALISLAYVAALSGRPASAREIAERHDIPVELLAKVLQRLAQRGVLKSQQGIHGGYLMARPADTVTVATVGAETQVNGLPAQLRVLNAEAGSEQLAVTTGGGNDNINASTLLATGPRLTWRPTRSSPRRRSSSPCKASSAATPTPTIASSSPSASSRPGRPSTSSPKGPC